jgi:large subunit ribosomal protein L19
MNIHEILASVEKPHLRAKVADVRVGDTVKVHYKIREGNKERVQVFEGLVIALKGGVSLQGSFTARKVVAGIGVERTFPLHSPWIVKIERSKTGKVRRAKLNFVRAYALSSKFKLKDKGKAGTIWDDMTINSEEQAKQEAEQVKSVEDVPAETTETEVETPETETPTEEVNETPEVTEPTESETDADSVEAEPAKAEQSEVTEEPKN